jgi:hypothetical protein
MGFQMNFATIRERIVMGFWGDVRREFTQRLSAALHGTLGSYLRDAFQEGNNANAVACLRVPRA